MIQRRQTIFLLCLAITAILLLVLNVTFFEVRTMGGDQVTVGYGKSVAITQGVITEWSNTVINLALIIMAGFAVIAIFLFRNRKRQMMLCYMNYVSYAVLILGVYLSVDEAIERIMNNPSEAKFTSGISWLVALLVLNILAMIRIRKDEALVKSLDRLR